MKSLSRVRLLATPWTAAYLPGSSIHEIFQARVLEWGAIAFSFCTASTVLSLDAHLSRPFWILTANFLALALSLINGLHFLVFGMLCVSSQPAQAPSPKWILHVSGSLTVYSNELSSFELHLLIYSAREFLTLCVWLCPGGLGEWSLFIIWESCHQGRRFDFFTFTCNPRFHLCILDFLHLEATFWIKWNHQSSRENQCTQGSWC